MTYETLISFQIDLVERCLRLTHEMSPPGEVAILESAPRIRAQTPSVHLLIDVALDAALRDIQSFEPREALRLLASLSTIPWSGKSEQVQRAVAVRLLNSDVSHLSVRDKERLAVLCGVEGFDQAIPSRHLTGLSSLGPGMPFDAYGQAANGEGTRGSSMSLFTNAEFSLETCPRSSAFDFDDFFDEE